MGFAVPRPGNSNSEPLHLRGKCLAFLVRQSKIRSTHPEPHHCGAGP